MGTGVKPQQAGLRTFDGEYAITVLTMGYMEPSWSASSAPRETPSTPMRPGSISGRWASEDQNARAALVAGWYEEDASQRAFSLIRASWTR